MLLSDCKDKTRPHLCHVPRHAGTGRRFRLLCTVFFSLFFFFVKYNTTVWLLASFCKPELIMFKDVWHNIFRVKRQIIQYPMPGVVFSFVTPLGCVYGTWWLWYWQLRYLEKWPDQMSCGSLCEVHTEKEFHFKESEGCLPCSEQMEVKDSITGGVKKLAKHLT